MADVIHASLDIVSQRLFTENLPIETDKLVIREIDVADIDDFHELINHPGFSYYCFDGSRESVESFVEDAISGQEAIKKGELRKTFMMAIENKASKELVGHVSVDLLDKAPEDYDLAYFTHPKHQGKGIAFEASSGFLKKVFEHLDPAKVVATVHPENFGSIKVLNRLGFRATGETSYVESADGKNERLWYTMTRDDFKKDECFAGPN